MLRADPELEGADVTPLSDTEIAAIETTTTPAARIIQESILGFDDRFQVLNTSTFPERAVSLITYNGSSYCTGWLVSRDTLVTAGHCVHGGGTQLANGAMPPVSKFIPATPMGKPLMAHALPKNCIPHLAGRSMATMMPTWG